MLLATYSVNAFDGWLIEEYEDAPSNKIEVIRNGYSGQAEWLTLAISGGTATANVDFEPPPTRVQVASSAIGGFVHIPLPTIDDNIFDSWETIEFTITGDDGGTGGGTVEIEDWEPVVSIARVKDGAETPDKSDPIVFRVSGGLADEPLTVNVGVSGGTATNGVDYTAPNSVTIPAGQWSADFFVTPVDDPLIETTETVQMEVLPNGDRYGIAEQDPAEARLKSNDPRVRLLSAYDVDDAGSQTDENFFNSGMSWAFFGFGTSYETEAVVNLSGMAQGWTNGFTGTTYHGPAVIPSGSAYLQVVAKPVMINDPNEGYKWNLVVTPAYFNQIVQGGNDATLTLGLSVDVIYTSATRATIRALFAAQLDEGAHGITSLGAKDGAVQWSNNAVHKHQNSGAWDVILELPE